MQRLRRHLVALAALLLLGLLVLGSARQAAAPEVGWPDEFIYLVGARNLVERGTLDTNFYLTHSILLRGYPHRDVHMPGYVLALAPLVARYGATLAAAVILNGALFLVEILLVYAIAWRLHGRRAPAFAAAALFSILPPFPGYLCIAYPEIVVTGVLLLGVAWLLCAPADPRRALAHAVVAGFLFASAALFRETLLLALPLYLVRLRRRELLRGFLPAALVTLALLVAPLAQHRAVHPNALYPSVLEEARRSPTPVLTLVSAVWANVVRNLELVLAADPARSAEDATLLFLAGLTVAASFGLRGQSAPVRRLGQAILASLAALLLAVLALYVVRERGGVWGGVRVLMSFAPLLLVCAVPLLLTRRRAVAVALVIGLGAVSAVMDTRQIEFFNHYKRSDLEDQERGATYVARYIDRATPRRVVFRSFLYGFTHYPVEVVWSLPATYKELVALEKAIDYEYIVLQAQSPLRPFLGRNPHYLRVNSDDRGAELLIWRRLE